MKEELLFKILDKVSHWDNSISRPVQIDGFDDHVVMNHASYLYGEGLINARVATSKDGTECYPKSLTMIGRRTLAEWSN